MSLPQIAGHDLEELIGWGSCGAVYRAVSADTGVACAVKVFNSMAINRKMLAIGMRGLQQMPDHPGILRPITFDFDASPYFLAMPLVGFMAQDGQGKKVWESPTLESSCGKVPADAAWRYIYEVGAGMAWLHKHNLVHCNLKPRNVLIEDDPASSCKIVDAVQGWISGVHHFDPTDHFMYMPPEQAEHADGLAVHGTSWDVYSFGVLSYRLLTGRFPRANEAFDIELHKQRIASGAMPQAMDNGAILQTVRAQTEIEWPSSPTSKWDAQRKQILERCLELEPRRRWHDLREVMHEFEKLEADFQIEDAREKIEIEKRRQARKVSLLRTASISGATLFISATVIGIYWRNHANLSDKTLQEITQVHKKTLQEKANEYTKRITEKEGSITFLNGELKSAQEHKRLADANLQMSQQAVDQFLTQLLQMPAGIGIEAEISEKQVVDAMAFYDRERPSLEKSDDLLPERARNYFNTAQLLLRKGRHPEAVEYLEKSKKDIVKLLQKPEAHLDVPRCQTLLGRTCRWLGTLKADDGLRSEALSLLEESVAALDPVVKADPKNRVTRFECASAWYELGKRARRDQQLAKAAAALVKVPPMLDPAAIGEPPNIQEQFLLARSRLELGLAERSLGKSDDAVKTIFDAMEVLVKLVERARPNNQEIALTLAEAYLEFAENVSGNLTTNDARESQTEAMNILMELVRQYPQWAEPRFLLARCYGDMASLERDKGNNSEALRRQAAALDSLGQLAKTNGTNTRYMTEYARQKGQHIQLLSDLGRSKESNTLAKEAVVFLQNLMQGNSTTLDELDRKSCGVLLAQLYGLLGQTSETVHDNKLAKTSFSKAYEQWQTLMAVHDDDEIIKDGLKWTKNRLEKLK